ncbi:hypothetical protein ACXYL9_00705 [Qipengyuania sp. CAU 1752]
MAQTAKRTGGTQAPISAHPVFPAIVALWFAALFGIGSLIMPIVLMERIVVAIGLPGFFSAAAPPLGVTAKLAFAVAASVFGALAGLVIARKVAAAQSGAEASVSVRPARRSEPALAKRPIVATEELGAEGLGPASDTHTGFDEPEDEHGSVPIPGRRRALSITDESGPSEYLASVPVPGEDFHEDIDHASSHGDQVAENHEDSSVEGMLDLGSFCPADPNERADRSNVIDEPDAPATQGGEGEAQVFGAVIGNRLFDAPARHPDTLDYAETDADPGASEAATHSPLELTMPEDEDLNFTKPEPTPETERYNPFAKQDLPQDADEEVLSEEFVEQIEDGEQAGAQESQGDLADLAMSDLIERFAKALKVAEETSAASTAVLAADIAEPNFDEDQAVPFTFQRGGAESPAPSAEIEFGNTHADTESDGDTSTGDRPVKVDFEFAARREAAVPMALRPLDLAEFESVEEDDEDPFQNGFTLAPAQSEDGRMFHRPSESAEDSVEPVEADTDDVATQLFARGNDSDAGDEDEIGSDDANVGFSSLLSMKRPLSGQPEFVRIDDEDDSAADQPDGSDVGPEPVVTFPGMGIGRVTPEPASAMRPFDAPPEATPTGGLAPAVPTAPKNKQSDPAETEKALREALEKLQRMSGAA